MKPRAVTVFAWLWMAALVGCSLQHPAFGALEDGGGSDIRDALSDSNVCGREGMLCCPSAPVCVTGAVCAADNLCIVRCPEGQATCGGRCTDRQNDVNHCGACGNSCLRPHAASACAAGACSVGGCDPGFADCDGDAMNGCEAELSRAPANCGACGVTCAFANAAASCEAGVCVRGACAAGFDDCDGDPRNGCEASLNTSLSHCGRCGSVCAIPMAESECAMGTCRVNRCPSGSGDCNSTMADGCETDVTTSVANCGGCGAACNFPHGVASCTAGVCALQSCENGYGNCDGDNANGCEVNLATSTSHCGMCDRRCAPTAAMGACVAGVCGVATCNANFANCDANAANGCEADTRTNPAHCGMCGRACALANAVSACAAGACVVTSCMPGFADCNRSPSDGCETNVAGDLGNCGACGRVCNPANAVGMCSAGACTIAQCDDRYDDCNRNAMDGCEVNLQASLTSCGACGRRCAPANAMAACASGECAILRCNAPFQDCDGMIANGCESNTQTSSTHCAFCNTACMPRAHATAACVGSACTFACETGYADCNGTASDGCEADLRQTSSCQSCSTQCSVLHGVPGCGGGGCAVTSCDAGWGNCDGRYSTGCETNTSTDAAHCGGCGRVCMAAGAVNRCESGACTYTACVSGRGDCDTSRTNGCETNITNSLTNCGACGRACTNGNGTTSCMSGTCRPMCAMNFGNCDGNAVNGCETDLQNSAMHCGACGRACTSPSTCSGGMCR